MIGRYAGRRRGRKLRSGENWTEQDSTELWGERMERRNIAERNVLRGKSRTLDGALFCEIDLRGGTVFDRRNRYVSRFASAHRL